MQSSQSSARLPALRRGQLVHEEACGTCSLPSSVPPNSTPNKKLLTLSWKRLCSVERRTTAVQESFQRIFASVVPENMRLFKKRLDTGDSFLGRPATAPIEGAASSVEIKVKRPQKGQNGAPQSAEINKASDDENAEQKELLEGKLSPHSSGNASRAGSAAQIGKVCRCRRGGWREGLHFGFYAVRLRD